MKLRLLNAVVLAEDYPTLVAWYRETFGLALKFEETENYRYTDLARDGSLVVGLAPAAEMGVEPDTPRNNAMVIQLAVSRDDIGPLCDRIASTGGSVPFGPSVDRRDGFIYAGVADPEGNRIWIIEDRDW